MWTSRFSHRMRAYVEPRTQHLDMFFFFVKLTPGSSFSRPWQYWGCWLHCSLQPKTIAAFIEVIMKWQVRSIGTTLEVRASLQRRYQRGRGGPVRWRQKLAWSVTDLPRTLLVCNRVMLDMMHQYGLESSLHQSYSKKWQRWRTHAHWMTF